MLAVLVCRCGLQPNPSGVPGTLSVHHLALCSLQQRVLLLCCCAGLAPFYEHLCTDLGWTPDQAKLTEMQTANAKQLEELEAKIKASSSIYCSMQKASDAEPIFCTAAVAQLHWPRCCNMLSEPSQGAAMAAASPCNVPAAHMIGSARPPCPHISLAAL